MFKLIKLAILNMIFIVCAFSQDCVYTIEEIYFDEGILSYYLSSFNNSDIYSNINIFTFIVKKDGINCPNSLNFNYTLKIFSPELGLTRYETIFDGKTQWNNEEEFIQSADIEGLIINENLSTESIISYISQSGRLPDGKYLFQFSIQDDNSEILSIHSKFIDVDKPLEIELLSPGGNLSNINNTYIFNRLPLFTWYSDFCDICTYGIRICEYNKNEHTSLQDALTDWSLLPIDQSLQFHSLPHNAHSFQSTSEGYVDLKVGKNYVWQIQRSFLTTKGEYHDYSQIYVFEVRSALKKELNYFDHHILSIQSLIGDEKFNEWFSPGGELEEFIRVSNLIKVNGDDLPLNMLDSLAKDLSNGKIKINNIFIK